MSESKSFASLSPTLLARKGAAKPAMRPQWQALSTYSTDVPLPPAGDELEDLGWNDMGEADEAAAHDIDQSSSVPDRSTVIPFGAPDEQLQQTPLTGGKPAIVRQQASLLRKVDGTGQPGDDHGPEPAPRSSPLIPLAAHRYARGVPGPPPAPDRQSALAAGRRAAFTLRVDEVRHLKLRLACTMQGRSAQQLVTMALDRLLDELPELDELAKRVRRR